MHYECPKGSCIADLRNLSYQTLLPDTSSPSGVRTLEIPAVKPKHGPPYGVAYLGGPWCTRRPLPDQVDIVGPAALEILRHAQQMERGQNCVTPLPQPLISYMHCVYTFIAIARLRTDLVNTS